MCRLEEKYLSKMLFFHSSPLRERYGMELYFTSRLGGYSLDPYNSLNLGYHVGDDKSKVENNRQKVSDLLGLGNDIYCLKQIHSSKIVTLQRENKNSLKKEPPQADALMTSMENTPIMVMGADCSLIVLADKANRSIAVVHSGWKGTLNKILTSALDHMNKRFASRTKDILMYIGPAIRRCCYDISRKRLEEFKKVYGEDNYYEQYSKIYMDLPYLVKMQAMKIGIPDLNIHDSNLCTFCDTRFFSYRREKNTGRQAAIAIIRD